MFVVMLLASSFFVMPSVNTVLFRNIKTPNLYLNKFLPWRLGLDLVGGTALVYDIDLSNVKSSDYQTVVNGLKDVIEKRINLYGVSEPRVTVVQKNGQYQLVVELAGIKDISQAIKQIGETPTLDFRENCQAVKDKDGKELGMACSTTELTGRHIERADYEISNQGVGRPIVGLIFNDEGAKLFEKITERNVGKPLAIFLDGQPISAPLVNEKIIGGKAQISGEGITSETARKLVERFNAGALSAPIKLASQRTVSASAASDALFKIIIAGFVGAIAVALFMLFNYRVMGLVSGLALVFYITFTLAIFKLVPGFTMSLAGITGFILSIGAAVDANILIFERAKEEMKRGISKRAAINDGFKFAWPSIWDSNVSTGLISLILYIFSSSFVKGFALTLLIGIVINLIVTYTVTRRLMSNLSSDRALTLKK